MCGQCGAYHIRGEYSYLTGRLLFGLGLGIQHRGFETCGEALDTGEFIKRRRRLGLIMESLPYAYSDRYPARSGILQVRYSTQGKEISKEEIAAQNFRHDSDLKNDRKTAQPMKTKTRICGTIALTHNGNITNTATLTRFLRKNTRYKIESDSDTEILILMIRYYADNPNLMHIEHLDHDDQIPPRLRKNMLKNRRKANAYFKEHQSLLILNATRNAMRRVKGTYSCIILMKNYMFIFRDPYENRPIKMARTHNYWIVASESCAWHKYGATFERDVRGGEIVLIDTSGYRIFWKNYGVKIQKCCFEKPYLMDPTTILTSPGNNDAGHNSVGEYRYQGGKILFNEHPCGPGWVIPVEESGIYYGQGYKYAHEKKHAGNSHLFNAFKKDRHATRAFMGGTAKDQELAADTKFFNLFHSIVEDIREMHRELGKVWLIFVDDSLVRSTTMKSYVARVRKAIEKHLPEIKQDIKIAVLFGVPQIKFPCYYGINMRTRQELAAAKWSVPEIKEIVDADYLGYISLKEFQKLQGDNFENYCYACLNGNFIIPINKQQQEEVLSTPDPTY